MKTLLYCKWDKFSREFAKLAVGNKHLARPYCQMPTEFCQLEKNAKFYPTFGIAVILMFNALFLSAQAIDIEKLAKSKPFGLSGNVSSDMMYSGTDMVLDNNAQPFQYFLKGVITATFYGQFSLPLSFSYSNRKFDTRYPRNQQNFNRFGISPKYKWITAHAGWSKMRFSKYSLNGHSFVGGGIEMIPGDYEVRIMHGRLLKAVTPVNTTSGPGSRPVFERWGSGIQVARKNKGNKYGISVFRAADDYTSLPGGLDSLGITPEENMVVSFDLKQKVNDFISFSLEYANSQITDDSRVGTGPEDFFSNHLYINNNSSTQKYNALKSQINARIKNVNVGLGYERVDPGYKSHGAYFYNNDFENFTISLSSPLANNKLNVNTSLGLERDNIKASKASSANRVIGQFNLTYMATEKLQFNTNYSNFRNITEFNPYANVPTTNPYDNIDSLRYAQVSQNTSVNITYNTTTETLGQSVMVMLSMMQTDAELGGVVQNTGADYYNSSVAYNVNIIPKNITTTLSCNYNHMAGAEQKSGMVSPSLGFNSKFFEVINSGLMYSWVVNTGRSAQNVQRLQYTASYVLQEKHNFSLSAMWMNRDIQSVGQETGKVNTFLARLGYTYSFNRK